MIGATLFGGLMCSNCGIAKAVKSQSCIYCYDSPAIPASGVPS